MLCVLCEPPIPPSHERPATVCCCVDMVYAITDFVVIVAWLDIERRYNFVESSLNAPKEVFQFEVPLKSNPDRACKQSSYTTISGAASLQQCIWTIEARQLSSDFWDFE